MKSEFTVTVPCSPGFEAEMEKRIQAFCDALQELAEILPPGFPVGFKIGDNVWELKEKEDEIGS